MLGVAGHELPVLETGKLAGTTGTTGLRSSSRGPLRYDTSHYVDHPPLRGR